MFLIGLIKIHVEHSNIHLQIARKFHCLLMEKFHWKFMIIIVHIIIGARFFRGFLCMRDRNIEKENFTHNNYNFDLIFFLLTRFMGICFKK